MFGYVTIDKTELRIRDYEMYRSYYCGFCRELREKYGVSGQISLTYDMTFVILLLTSLYELPVQKGTSRCILHPALPRTVRKSEATEYGADMNILLTYYKCMDDWKDEKKAVRRGYAALLSHKAGEVAERYPGKASRIRELLEELSGIEKSGSLDPDLASGCFGRILSEVFVWKQDIWEDALRKMGFFLGKYIYLMDAYEDAEKDLRTGNYNLFADKFNKEGFVTEVSSLLMMMMSEACREFERLPVIRYADILRNILYSGVWIRYRRKVNKEKQLAEKGERK